MPTPQILALVVLSYRYNFVFKPERSHGAKLRSVLVYKAGLHFDFKDGLLLPLFLALQLATSVP